MKCCTFCSNESEMLFNHMINDIGALCLDCYMKLRGDVRYVMRVCCQRQLKKGLVIE